MTNDKQTEKFVLKRRRAISPILAVVVLLGITVVAGGIVFSLFSTSATTASATDVIAIQNAQAVKGTSHADITATVKNAGSQPWSKIEMTVSKSELSEPILYESLHENVVGCDDVAGTCSDGVDNAASGADGNRDNPLRAQWLISLDKQGGTENAADPGEGAAVGRKLVFDNKDDLRTILVLNGTAVAPLFGGFDQDGLSAITTKMSDKITALGGSGACSPTAGTAFTGDCTPIFQALDSSTDGNIFCRDGQGDDTIVAQCEVFTHTNIQDSPIGAGQSVFFYADVFTKEIPGLDNQVARVGDSLVVNIASENAEGGTARVQTIIKVAGI